jgi:2,6-dihydroxypyridine 3-monooxygenase
MGGSLGGLNAALFARDAGCDTVVYERSRHALAGQGAGIVLHPSTVRYLTERAGQDIDGVGAWASSVRYVDRDGQAVGEQEAGYRFTSYTTLHRRLSACLEPERYHLGRGVTTFSQDDDGVTVTLEDGTEDRCDLLVAADGLRSMARARLVPDAELQYAGYVAWRGTVPTEQLSASTRALLDDAITYSVMPDSHLLTYPIPDGDDGATITNWLWYRNVDPEDLGALLTDRDGERRDLSLAPGAARDEVVEQLREDAARLVAPPLAEVLGATRSPFLQVIVDAAPSRTVVGRVCMLGDAAFVCRPHAAAGTAKAAEEAYLLGEALGAHPSDVSAALAAFEPLQSRLGHSLLDRARRAGIRAQLENDWTVGEPLPFGLYRTGDSLFEPPGVVANAGARARTAPDAGANP